MAIQRTVYIKQNSMNALMLSRGRKARGPVTFQCYLYLKALFFLKTPVSSGGLLLLENIVVFSKLK